MTVHVDVEGVANGVVTETVPTEFTYESTTALSLHDSSDLSTGKLVFTFTGGADFTYKLTAPSAEGTYEPFSGELDPGDIVVGGPTSLDVSTTPVQTGPDVTSNDLDFDVVKSKAVKGATVSGVGYPIATNPMKWVVDNSEGLMLGAFDGSVGDFVVEETEDGSDEFILKVATSNAPNLSGSQSIRVDLTYTDADGEESTSTLTGTINEATALSVAESFTFTIPSNVASDTPIGSFGVSGALDDESLDGIVSGDDSSPVRCERRGHDHI